MKSTIKSPSPDAAVTLVHANGPESFTLSGYAADETLGVLDPVGKNMKKTLTLASPNVVAVPVQTPVLAAA